MHHFNIHGLKPPTAPLAALLSGLLDHAGFGWSLKESTELRYIASHGGLLKDMLVPGKADGDLFDAHSAALMRSADLRCLRQGEPLSEVHRMEVRGRSEDVRAFRIWRYPVTPQGDSPQVVALLSIWIDIDIQARHDRQVAHLQRQLAEQQALISHLQGLVEAEPPPSGVRHTPAGTPYTPTAAPLTLIADPTSPQEFSAVRALTLPGPAREVLFQALTRETDLSYREERTFGLLFMGISLWRAPADMQAACDLQFKNMLRDRVRGMDTVVDMAPGVLAIVLSGAAIAPAFARAEALRRACAGRFTVNGERLMSLVVSAGMSAYPLHARDPETMAQRGALALDLASVRGSGQTRLAAVPFKRPKD